MRIGVASKSQVQGIRSAQACAFPTREGSEKERTSEIDSMQLLSPAFRFCVLSQRETNLVKACRSVV